MRHCTLLAVFAAGLVCAGCSSVLSLEPVAPGVKAVNTAGLAGIWEQKGEDDPFVIREKDGAYEIRFGDQKFEATVFAIGDAVYLDVAPAGGPALAIPGHAAVRIWLEGPNSLRWAFADSEWFREKLCEKALPSKTIEKVTVLTGSAERLRTALAEYGMDDRTYGTANQLTRAR